MNKEIINKIANGNTLYDMGNKEHTISKFRYFSCKWSENEETSSHPKPGADGNAWSKLNKLRPYCLQNLNSQTIQESK
jgi:hypothetical protein